jgi:hypothetical protein
MIISNEQKSLKKVTTACDILQEIFKLLQGVQLKEIRLVSKSFLSNSTKLLMKHIVITNENHQTILGFLGEKGKLLYVIKFFFKFIFFIRVTSR